MRDLFWPIMAFPIIWPFIARMIWPRAISLRELVLNIVIAAGATTIVWHSGVYSATHDVEVWNGAITGKQQVSVPCGHSYPCNCTKNKDGSESCQTCYEHINDYDWEVYSTAGDFDIPRVDRQGTFEPKRWTQVRVGEAASIAHAFTNYVKAVRESLFHDDAEIGGAYKDQIPPYPNDVYDFYHVDRVLAVGLTVPDLEQWNIDLQERLKILGPTKQANAVVVITSIADPSYANALKAVWSGAKKNDTVLVIGVSAPSTISWVSVFSWSKNELLNVALRDDIKMLGVLDRRAVLDTLALNIKNSFERRSMKEFEYLKDEIDPPLWAVIIASVFAVLGSVLLSLYFRRADL